MCSPTRLLWVATVRTIVLCGVGFGVGCRPANKDPASLGHVDATIHVPLRVVVAQADQQPVPFPSLAIFGCPANEVRRILRRVEREYAEEQKGLHSELDRRRIDCSAAEKRVKDEEDGLKGSYNANVPQQQDEVEVMELRNPLAALSRARAIKSQVDFQYQQDQRLKLDPLRDELKRKQEDVEAAHAEIARLRQDLARRLFDALPAQPAMELKTDSDGRATMVIGRNEPWYVWAAAVRTVSTTRETEGRIDARTGRFQMSQRDGGYERTSYRWLMLVPDELDSSGQLCLDQSNVFDGDPISLKLGDEQESTPFIRPASP